MRQQAHHTQGRKPAGAHTTSPQPRPGGRRRATRTRRTSGIQHGQPRPGLSEPSAHLENHTVQTGSLEQTDPTTPSFIAAASKGEKPSKDSQPGSSQNASRQADQWKILTTSMHDWKDSLQCLSPHSALYLATIFNCF